MSLSEILKTKTTTEIDPNYLYGNGNEINKSIVSYGDGENEREENVDNKEELVTDKSATSDYKKFIKNDIATFSKDIDTLRNLIRYQNVHRNINESVAEHSFYTACLVLKIREYYNFNLEVALKTALIHDIMESKINDMPHNIKMENPALADAILQAEEKVTKSMFYCEAHDLIRNFNNGSTPEGLACQLADILSVVLYANAEIKSGNTVFNYIAIKAIARCKEVIDKFDFNRNLKYSKEQILNKINQIVNIY